MKTFLLGLATIGLVFILMCAVNPHEPLNLAHGAEPTERNDKMLAHMVYFTLNDGSPAARKKLIDACQQHLTGHPGTVFFGCGEVADLDREVNVRDFDIGLHVVFESRAAHDVYQTHPRHLQFIEENRASWKQVRVFDADLVK